jgi:predicted  nucleic acid-binding Zn-ribbon protein
LEKRDNEIVHLDTENRMIKARYDDIEQEMELKSGENNRLRKQVADLEAAMNDLYVSRKGNGDL